MIDIKDIICIDCAKFNINDKNIQKITNRTQNTWQENKYKLTKKKDTKLGKIAEFCVNQYLKTNIKTLNLLSYNDFRTDNFKKHAPFDCLLFNDNVNIEQIINKINNEVSKFAYGSINDKLKYEYLQNKIYICEIKSTRINKRHLLNKKK
ncbi:hypothetical protein FMM56_06790 [Campylobacter sp. LR264d]|uniref:hypothetical protein n=1 Tax=Campylobacter sp. LR264d TaxID=2593544 RepID=UPI00123BA61D|nr:hypothetical protein [Campylobacter sp. LR264d]KAA6230108.1 hypothetical protein FMM56_06790 [Campylobacter sp. LR264d]